MNLEKITLPYPPDTRRPSNCEDWGDILTIGLSLKTRDTNLPIDKQFAIYLGNNEVLTNPLNKNIEKRKIKYNSPEEMHEIWILD